MPRETDQHPDIVILFDETLAVWEFQARSERARRWLELSGYGNVYRAQAYACIILRDQESVQATRTAAERAGLTVAEPEA